MNLRSVLLPIGLLTVLAVRVSVATPPGSAHDGWKQVLQTRIPLYGHRNWIVIADAAYPSQAGPGIETIVADAGQFDVLDFTLKSLANSRHLTPTIYTDQELHFLTDKDAPGISGYRDQLMAMLGDRKTTSLLHEKLIDKLDTVSKTFRVLIVKTNIALPYTTVFLQLDCAYWPSEAEARLRAVMAKHVK
jgi:hypothetical protein